MAISLTIDGKEAALKKGSSIEYVSENRIFTDADDYSMEIELPLAECPQNINIFGHLTRKDVDCGQVFFDAVLRDTKFHKRGAVVITGITEQAVKVQFLEKRSYQNFYPEFDETYIDELDLGEWPHIHPDNLSSNNTRPGRATDGGTNEYKSNAEASSLGSAEVQPIFNLVETLARLNNTVTGDLGIKQAQDDYQHKSPKNKRK